jgi:hypothetical protein
LTTLNSSGTDTITISNGSTSYYNIGGTSSSPTFTLNNTGTISVGSIGATISTINVTGAGSGWTWQDPVEFVDSFPDFNRIQKMCEEYPGLKIAYEKFVTTYKLVKDHYDTPEDQRPIS